MALSIETARLRLRSYTEADIPELLALIGTPEVAATTLRIAHPYTEDDARAFLALAQEPDKIWLAITWRSDDSRRSSCVLRIHMRSVCMPGLTNGRASKVTSVSGMRRPSFDQWRTR